VLVLAAGGLAQPRLQLDEAGQFKLLMLADMHYGEDEDGSWGPVQDINSTKVQNSVIGAEQRSGLGLVVFLGDMITGNNVRSNASAYWDRFTLPVRTNFSGLPWATVLGNHDDYAFQSAEAAASHGGRAATAVDRRTLLGYDLAFRDSLTQMGPAGVSLASNYWIPVMNGTAPAMLLYFLDTGGGRSPEIVYPDQVQWLAALRKQHLAEFGPGVAALLFMHIPCAQYQSALHSSDGFFGMALDGITPTANDTGVFEVAASTGISAVFAGHDHGNDFCGKVRGVWLCYGRHSGYGGYGSWRRGARVVQFSADGLRTWVRMQDGEIADEGLLN